MILIKLSALPYGVSRFSCQEGKVKNLLKMSLSTGLHKFLYVVLLSSLTLQRTLSTLQSAFLERLAYRKFLNPS